MSRYWFQSLPSPYAFHPDDLDKLVAAALEYECLVSDMRDATTAVIEAADTLVETIEGNVYLEAVGAIEMESAITEIVMGKTKLRDVLAALARRLEQP